MEIRADFAAREQRGGESNARRPEHAMPHAPVAVGGFGRTSAPGEIFCKLPTITNSPSLTPLLRLVVLADDIDEVPDLTVVCGVERNSIMSNDRSEQRVLELFRVARQSGELPLRN